ncbi:MAG: hypothetical protein Q7T41_01865 [Candidatus Saccharibacteria bacterium]|nr:hypothetical protein [Candidatus Saccharibacteria bacterium]
MGVYEAAKDALKIAQKADNAELVQKILDVQEQALNMQEKQINYLKTIDDLERKIKSLEEQKKFTFPEGSNYLVDPDSPERKLCPICTKTKNTAVPLDGYYCRQCKGEYSS